MHGQMWPYTETASNSASTPVAIQRDNPVVPDDNYD
jgi:hypothetical protein